MTREIGPEGQGGEVREGSVDMAASQKKAEEIERRLNQIDVETALEQEVLDRESEEKGEGDPSVVTRTHKLAERNKEMARLHAELQVVCKEMEGE